MKSNKEKQIYLKALKKMLKRGGIYITTLAIAFSLGRCSVKDDELVIDVPSDLTSESTIEIPKEDIEEILEFKDIKYTIKSGDTLESIASKFGVSKDIIKQKNNITAENYIYAGETLVIPNVSIKIAQELGYVLAENIKELIGQNFRFYEQKIISSEDINDLVSVLNNEDKEFGLILKCDSLNSIDVYKDYFDYLNNQKLSFNYPIAIDISYLMRTDNYTEETKEQYINKLKSLNELLVNNDNYYICLKGNENDLKRLALVYPELYQSYDKVIDNNLNEIDTYNIDKLFEITEQQLSNINISKGIEISDNIITCNIDYPSLINKYSLNNNVNKTNESEIKTSENNTITINNSDAKMVVLDISSQADGQERFDFKQLKENGIDLVIIRYCDNFSAANGYDYLDPLCNTFINKAIEADMDYAIYYFPELNTTIEESQKEASELKEFLDGYSVKPKFIAYDLEIADNASENGVHNTKYNAALAYDSEFPLIDTLNAHKEVLKDSYGTPIVYLNGSMMQRIIDAGQGDIFKEFPLWFCGGSRYSQQFTASDVTEISSTYDLNYLENLVSQFGYNYGVENIYGFQFTCGGIIDDIGVDINFFYKTADEIQEELKSNIHSRSLSR